MTRVGKARFAIRSRPIADIRAAHAKPSTQAAANAPLFEDQSFSGAKIAMGNLAVWICPSCGLRRKAQFCSNCGEERLRPKDLTLTDLTAQFAKNVSSVDGRLLKSIRSILTAPGALTAAHIRGERRSYLGPLALFFIANAVFVLLQTGLGAVLSSPLDSHLHEQDWSSLARSMVGQQLQENGQSLAAYAAEFDEAVAFNAKTLMILMVLAFVPLPIVLFRRQHRAVGAHFVFALHLYVFVLALLCISLLLAEADLLLGGQGLRSQIVDHVLAVFSIAACGIYIYAALGPAYGSSGAARVVKAAVLTSAVGALFLGYRFAIFLITLYTT
jgi:hypothetical protein